MHKKAFCHHAKVQYHLIMCTSNASKKSESNDKVIKHTFWKCILSHFQHSTIVIYIPVWLHQLCHFSPLCPLIAIAILLKSISLLIWGFLVLTKVSETSNHMIRHSIISVSLCAPPLLFLTLETAQKALGKSACASRKEKSSSSRGAGCPVKEKKKSSRGAEATQADGLKRLQLRANDIYHTLSC